MTLNLSLLYFVWTEEYCQPSPNKNKSPNLWHVTSILVCCIFACYSSCGVLALSWFFFSDQSIFEKQAIQRLIQFLKHCFITKIEWLVKRNEEPKYHSSTITSLPHTSRGARTDTIHVHKYTKQQQKRYLSPVKNELDKKSVFSPPTTNKGKKSSLFIE